ncbi:PepSY domain-containing protein [Paenibacillus massiliensis]|uniref:PepSY domain-containing protein n=1 Tax=Paenibacillus massiliensis TaxID=225917 RepID=UPI00041F694B|nr:PepSY domain-containing protein [Paenibacillus massiliensis]
MKRSKRMIGWVAAAVLVFLVLLMAGTQWLRQEAPVTALSQEQAIRSVLAQYEGEVERVQLHEGSYRMQLRSTQGLYELKVNPVDGMIHSIQRLETPAASAPVAAAFPVPAGASEGHGSPAEGSSGGNGQAGRPDGNQGSAGDSTDASGSGSTDDSSGKGAGEGSGGTSGNKPATGQGTATDGQRAVSEREAARLAQAQVPGEVKEIEYSGRGSNRYYLVEIDSPNKGEAVVQIHAISGKVMSIAWDDDDEEDDDDDDA